GAHMDDEREHDEEHDERGVDDRDGAERDYARRPTEALLPEEKERLARKIRFCGELGRVRVGRAREAEPGNSDGSENEDVTRDFEYAPDPGTLRGEHFGDRSRVDGIRVPVDLVAVSAAHGVGEASEQGADRGVESLR